MPWAFSPTFSHHLHKTIRNLLYQMHNHFQIAVLGLLSLKSLVRLVALQGVVGLVAFEGLLGLPLVLRVAVRFKMLIGLRHETKSAALMARPYAKPPPTSGKFSSTRKINNSRDI